MILLISKGVLMATAMSTHSGYAVLEQNKQLLHFTNELVLVALTPWTVD